MLSTTVLISAVLSASFTPVVKHALVDPQGHARLTTGELSQPLQGDLRDAVRTYALSRRDALGLPLTSALGAPQVFGTRFGASFHLRQLVGGFEVHDGRVVVTVDAQRRVVQLGSSVRAYRQAVLDWRISADEALKIASAATEGALGDTAGKPYGGTKRMMFQRGDEVRSGYLVYVPTLDLTKNWYLAIDSASGIILWRQNRAFHAADDADVYEISPGTAGVGVTPVKRVTLSHFLEPRAAGGVLEGDQLSMYNCCPNEGCDPAGTKKRAVGTTTFSGFTINYNVAICDRVQRASNDPAFNATGDYVFAPVDPPPAGSMVDQSVAADSDPFVEAQAFFHVNNAYDFVRGLSAAAAPLFPDQSPPITGFQMRDELLGKKPAVWTNVTVPNQQEAFNNYDPNTNTATSNSLSRLDNAAFMAKENFEQLNLPGIAMDVDTLMLFQGNAADFGYDVPILWHEFGHGVIHSTAAFSSFTIDERSGNNEGGALHEAFADYFAGAQGNRSAIGDYVGPKLAAQTGKNGPIRDMANTFSCPTVLWGEVHEDSQHFAGALWDARGDLGSTTALRDQFDATLYGALVSMTPGTDFVQAAAAISNHVKIAFGATGEARMNEIFNARGVTQCSKVVDLTGDTAPRKYYGIGGWQQAGFTSQKIVPGPYQMKLSLPNGAKSLSVTAAFQSSSFGASTATAQLLARTGSPITFTRTSTNLTSDAEKSVAFTAGTTTQSATTALEVPCGAELYFTVGSKSGGGESLQNLTYTVVPADSCAVDAGTPVDAGTAIPEPVVLQAIPGGGTEGGGAAVPGCGCASANPMLFGAAILLLLGLIRRRA